MQTHKKQIKELKKKIKEKSKQFKEANDAEKHAISKWRKWFTKYMKASEDLATLKYTGTNKEKRLKEIICAGRGQSPIMTAERDAARKESSRIQDELNALGLELARYSDQQRNEVAATDEIVGQVFNLNSVVVEGSINREKCLNHHVFPRLIVDGKLSSQVSFISSDGLRKVVAMVNRMTIIQGDLAQEAKGEIGKFFNRFQSTTMDVVTRALYELTQQLLSEKTTFKVGPDFYRFIAMELDAKIFPELHRAQQLLRRSIRSEKTDKYVRLSERTDRNGKWIPVRQS